MITSHLSRVNSYSQSVKTTIPHHIIKELRLKFKDVVEWQVQVNKGKKYACIRKLS